VKRIIEYREPMKIIIEEMLAVFEYAIIIPIIIWRWRKKL